MSSERDILVYKASLAESAERYDDMAGFMKDVSNIGTLTAEERNLLSVAYKNVVGPLRAGWRVVSSIEETELKKGSAHLDVLREYKDGIESKLEGICGDIGSLITNTLLPNDESEEGKVFFWKMKGDYARYLAEIQSGEKQSASAGVAKEAYAAALDIAKDPKSGMASTHPIRLGLALNFSVFYYEIIQDAGKAIAMAQSAFDEAMAELDRVDEEQYKDATLIMQLLKDNLTLWSEDEGNNNPQKAADNDMEVQDL